MLCEGLSDVEITALLRAWQQGDSDALSRVITLVYGDLRRLAAAYFKQERPDHTLEPTALVHEVYQQLLSSSPVFKDRMHFLRCACMMMRRLLVKHARARKAEKRDGAGIDDNPFTRVYPDPDTLLGIHGALDRLQADDPRMWRIVEMRFFLGLSVDEVADYLKLSARTVKREWVMARSLLAHQLKSGAAG